MDTAQLQFPFELYMTTDLLHKNTEYCCMVNCPETEQSEHFHLQINHIEINHDYKVIIFNKQESTFTKKEENYTTTLEKIKANLYPIIAKVSHCGTILEILNFTEIEERHVNYYNLLYSPLLSDETNQQLREYFEDFYTDEALVEMLQSDRALQLFLFPLYGTFEDSHKYYRNEYEKNGELQQWTFDARLNENLNEEDNIQIELTGVYNKSHNFFHNTTHTFCYDTHELLSIKGEMTQTDSENINFTFEKFIEDEDDNHDDDNDNNDYDIN